MDQSIQETPNQFKLYDGPNTDELGNRYSILPQLQKPDSVKKPSSKKKIRKELEKENEEVEEE